MIEKIAAHLADFSPRLHSNTRSLYQYCPIPIISYPQLENELFCNIYYLRHLCDTARFPDWPINEPVMYLSCGHLSFYFLSYNCFTYNDGLWSWFSCYMYICSTFFSGALIMLKGQMFYSFLICMSCHIGNLSEITTKPILKDGKIRVV